MIKNALLRSLLSMFAILVGSAPTVGQDAPFPFRTSITGLESIVSFESMRLSRELIDPKNTPNIRLRLGEMVLRWVATKHEAVGTLAGFVTGQVQNDVFGDRPAIRVTIIVPSEMFRDTAQEWDKFQVVATWMYQLGTSTTSIRTARNIYLSVENYSRRNRGLINPNGTPSLDWDFVSIDDLTVTNAVLKQIGDKLVEVAIADPGNTRADLLR